MIEERQRLRDDPLLLQLLRQYAERGAADRATWQDRVMELEGTDAPALVQLHGTLLACDWVEMNVGVTAGTHVGAGMYRVTLDGLRALGQFHQADDADEEPVPARREGKPKRQRGQAA